MEKDYSELPVTISITVAAINLLLKHLGNGPLHEVHGLYQGIQNAQQAAIQAAREADKPDATPPEDNSGE